MHNNWLLNLFQHSVGIIVIKVRVYQWMLFLKKCNVKEEEKKEYGNVAATVGKTKVYFKSRFTT